MIVYSSAGVYVADAGTDLVARIARINQIIDALEIAALDAASNSGINEYSLDDGQTKIQQAYRNPAEIMRSINAFKQQKHYYLNQLNGNVVRLVDGKNLTRYNNGRY